MRTIIKGAEPQSLTTHRLLPYADYDNYADRDALRHSLVTEQRGLCCYCLGRIHNGPDTMKIEHWHCQSRYPDEELSYRNLLGVCIGGEGQPGHLQHCDTRKGDQDIRWNPSDTTHFIETRIRYEADGTIRSDDADFDDQLNEVLNLNIPVLKNNRKGVLTAVLTWWKQEKMRIQGSVPRDRFERQRYMLAGGEGSLQPYCQVAIWWLEQRTNRMTP